ncbi:unknown [Helicoverpa armigera nucleopolyhedrovirus]|nr:hypothetical protein HanGV4gp081 [Helicoverpa armigera nucleopolyhedrovirus G4]NP_203636.1 hypothetical protein [Helicoverpa armigera nucleopolyhedrovirus]AAL56090.1 ORF84 [Helicoverpa zea single nucleopolyhedrovirus]AEN04004.1 hypothetical protein [Helicoverpa armigera NPV strain Australia]AXR98068.1 hypothetical protein [Helicoverpa assulta nucleopolyhedrovirus]BAG74648.1 hypothetical protein [Helicoverpa armigera NPV NNg1]AAG53824.1 unknown [Helicoverpa armigera nucleopolyhedrovirus G4]
MTSSQEQQDERTIYLYLCDPPENVQNNKQDDDSVIYFEGIIECMLDETCDKFSFFSELKKEEALFMKKTYNDLIEHNNGTYFKYHVLLDALIMYKTFVELVDDSAFGKSILTYCEQFVAYIFKLFRLQSRIVVVLPPNVNWEEDNLSALLNHLLQLSVIQIV